MRAPRFLRRKTITNFMNQSKAIKLPDGREITIETGKLAKQADGAVEVRMGNTMLLATVCSGARPARGRLHAPHSRIQREIRIDRPVSGRFFWLVKAVRTTMRS